MMYKIGDGYILTDKVSYCDHEIIGKDANTNEFIVIVDSQKVKITFHAEGDSINDDFTGGMCLSFQQKCIDEHRLFLGQILN